MDRTKNPSKDGCFQIIGWKTGFEPATLGTTNRCSNQLSYNHHLISCDYQVINWAANIIYLLTSSNKKINLLT